MVVEGFALYFLIGMQFMIIATMSAKGYGIFRYAALISWFTSPLLVLLLCLFLVPARKGSFWDAD
jgi:hypothetical protein